MKASTLVAGSALPGLAAALIGRIAGQAGVADGGLWSALVAALAAVWLIAPLGPGVTAQAARLGFAFLTRLVGALLVAALAGNGRADLLVTLIACLLAAMAIDLVLMLRAQESARV